MAQGDKEQNQYKRKRHFHTHAEIDGKGFILKHFFQKIQTRVWISDPTDLKLLLDKIPMISILSNATRFKGGYDELLFLQIYLGRPGDRVCLANGLLGEYCLNHHWGVTRTACS
jgi:hypothetical protein